MQESTTGLPSDKSGTISNRAAIVLFWIVVTVLVVGPLCTFVFVGIPKRQYIAAVSHIEAREVSAITIDPYFARSDKYSRTTDGIVFDPQKIGLTPDSKNLTQTRIKVIDRELIAKICDSFNRSTKQRNPPHKNCQTHCVVTVYEADVKHRFEVRFGEHCLYNVCSPYAYGLGWRFNASHTQLAANLIEAVEHAQSNRN